MGPSAAHRAGAGEACAPAAEGDSTGYVGWKPGEFGSGEIRMRAA